MTKVTITFAGLPGSGKSKLSKLVQQLLQEDGLDTEQKKVLSPRDEDSLIVDTTFLTRPDGK